MSDWHKWSPCEMYGHAYERSEDSPLRVCRDCETEDWDDEAVAEVVNRLSPAQRRAVSLSASKPHEGDVPGWVRPSTFAVLEREGLAVRSSSRKLTPFGLVVGREVDRLHRLST